MDDIFYYPAILKFAVVGAITLALISQVKWAWIPVLLLGSFVGGYLGAHLAVLKGNLWIKRGYEIVTILVGLNLLR